MGNLAVQEVTGLPASALSNQLRNNAVATALSSDESALFGGSSPASFTDLVLSALATPANVTVTTAGTAGSTTVTYVVVDVSNGGYAAATGVAVTTANATLSTVNYNIISWTSIPGHTYQLYRTTAGGSPSALGLIATVTATLATLANGLSPTLNQYQLTVNDTALNATTPLVTGAPSGNTSGCIQAPGPIETQSVVVTAGVTSLTSTLAMTLTAAQLLSTVLLRSGTSATQTTTPSAAALVAALPGVKVGQCFRVHQRNACSGSETIAAGSGITLNGTAALTSVSARDLIVAFLNVTPGTESVTVYLGPGAVY